MKKLITTIALLSMVSTAFASIDQNLKYGQRNDNVSELQEFLFDRGFLGVSPTGFFGVLTLKAVKAYQLSESLPTTGYVGVLTRGKINEALLIDVASSTEAEVAETGTTTPTVQPTSTVIYLPVYQKEYIYVQPEPVVAPVIEAPVVPTEQYYQPIEDNSPVITLTGERILSTLVVSWKATGYREPVQCTLNGKSVDWFGKELFTSEKPETFTMVCVAIRSAARASKTISVE